MRRSGQSLRLAAWATAAALTALPQTPENFFRRGGADFRGTAPEQKLYWQPHIANSHRRILEAAGFARGKHIATVLGCGVAAEIPLAELARRFDRLILVDLDGPSMLDALQQLPLDLRSKVEFRVMDVTSFATALMDHMSEAIDASAGLNETFRRWDVLFDNLAPGEPVNLPASDLTVSSLLLSEIARYPFGYADRLMRARYNIPLQKWDRFGAAFQKLLGVSIEDHARLLASLARSDGVVYFSDTLLRGPVSNRISPEGRTAVERSVIADFQRLGLAQTPDEVEGAVGRLCEAEHPVKIEVKAYESFLDAHFKIDSTSFEPLLSWPEVQKQLSRQGLVSAGPRESWWWLSYPCSIARDAGAFYVTSWILRRAAVGR